MPWFVPLGLLLAAAAPAPQRAMFGGTPARNGVSDETGLPVTFDLATRRNVKWVADLGTETYAGPVVAGGRVYVGTNNERPRDRGAAGDRGVLLAFAAADGSFLWQATHLKLAAGRSQDWPLQGLCSTPSVEGDRLYYVSNRGEMVALDVAGFQDGENDGPFLGETARGERDADIVWMLDLIGALGVVPRYMSASSPVVAGDLVFVVTGNGPAPDGRVPVPTAPSFVAVDRHSGALRWRDASPGEGLLDGQWGSPAYAQLAGRPQVIFPAGDGRLYAFAPESGRRLWSFDANASPGPEIPPMRAAILATPVVHGDRVFVAVGRDPQHAAEPGRLWALDVRPAAGDGFRVVPAWSLGGREFATSLSMVVVADGVVYAADFAGFLRALDAATGAVLWRYDAFAAIWGSPFVADGKVYFVDEDGDLAVLRAGRRLEVLAETNLDAAAYTTPTARDGVLYVASSSRLYALAEGAGRPPIDERRLNLAAAFAPARTPNSPRGASGRARGVGSPSAGWRRGGR